MSDGHELPEMQAGDIEAALGRVGELLEAQDKEVASVIAGGAALSLTGVVRRVTRDVDVSGMPGEPIGPRVHLPPALVEAAREVARDHDLPADWLNAEASTGLTSGTPTGWMDRATWRRFGGLRVGLAARVDLIWLKLWAAADRVGSEKARHLSDLAALQPTESELERAVEQLADVDGNPEFRDHLKKTAAEVRDALR
jgi:hypothetical protein